MADANINIGVEIDSSKFDEAIKSLGLGFNETKRIIEELNRVSVDTFGGKNQKEIDRLTSRLSKQTEEIHKATNRAEDLRQQYEYLAAGGGHSEIIYNISNQLEKINAAKDKELAKNDEILKQYIAISESIEMTKDIGERTGMVHDVSESVKKQEELSDSLDLSTGKLETMTQRSEALKKQLSEIELATGMSEEARKVRDRLEEATIKLTRMSSEAEVTKEALSNIVDKGKIGDGVDVGIVDRLKESIIKLKAPLDKVKGSMSRSMSTKPVGVLRNAIESLKGPIEKLNRRVMRIAKSVLIYQLVRGVFRGIRDHVSELIQSNEVLSNSMATLRANLLVAFQPVWELILPALQKLVEWLNLAAVMFGRFMSGLLGRSLSESRQSVAAMHAQKNAVDNQTSALNKNEKAYDKVGKAAKKASKNVQGFDQLNKMSDPDTDDGVGLGGVGSSGLGGVGVGGASVPALDFGDDGGDWGDAFERAGKKVREAIDRVWEVLKPFKDRIVQWWDDNKDAIKDRVVRAIQWIRDNSDTIIKVIKFLAVAITAIFMGIKLAGFVAKVKGFVDTVSGLFGAGGLLGSITLSGAGIALAIAAIGLALYDLWQNNEEFREKVVEAWEGIKEIFIQLWEEVLSPILESIGEAVSQLWNEHLKPLWDDFVDAVGEIAMLVLDLWNNILQPIIGEFISQYGPKLVLYIQVIVGAVGAAIGAIIDIVRSLLRAITDIVASIRKVLDGIMEFLTGMFTGDWERMWSGLETIVEGVWDAIGAVIKLNVNLIISLVNGMIRAIYRGLNATSDFVNKMGFTIPEWVPVIGGNEFRIPKMNLEAPQIPMLAKGGLIPPRKPRQVIVGDNMREDEIVSPVSTMEKAVQDAIIGMGGLQGGNQEMLNILSQILTAVREGQVIELDQREFGRTVVRSIGDAKGQTGVSLV